MYKELSKEEDFSKSYPTWIIAYCLDANSFFATDQRCFFWEHNNEFSCESDAIIFFKTHLDEFRKIRNETFFCQIDIHLPTRVDQYICPSFSH